MDKPKMKAWMDHMAVCDFCKDKCFYGRVGGGNRTTIARSLCAEGKPLYESFLEETDRMALEATKETVKKAVLGLAVLFTMDELFQTLHRHERGWEAYNTEVQKAAWAMVDDGTIEHVGGKFKLKTPT